MGARMEDIYCALVTSPVFAGIERGRSMDRVIEELGCYRKRYFKDEVICHVGDGMTSFPVILSGVVEARIPSEGRSQIVDRFGMGESFAEVVPMTLGSAPVEIIAFEDVDLLQIPAARLMAATSQDAVVLRANIISEMAKKVSSLSSKLALLAEPRLRRRVLMFLSELRPSVDGVVTLPFSRKDFAGYLGVNDKALLRELRRMQDDGIIWADGRKMKVLTEEPRRAATS